MTNFCGKISRKYPSARGLLLIIDQVTASTCADAADFTSDEKNSTMILSNVTANVSEISNSDTRYRNIKLNNTKQFYSRTLSRH